MGEDTTGVDKKGTEEEPDLRYSWSNVKIGELSSGGKKMEGQCEREQGIGMEPIQAKW